MTLIEIFSILLIHYIADFVLQTDEQAKGKSTRFAYLLAHTAVYSLFWFAAIAIMKILLHLSGDLIYFAPITFVCHTVTDYYTSRVNSQLYKENKTHEFFNSIGFDQLLHYFQLFITYYYLTR